MKQNNRRSKNSRPKVLGISRNIFFLGWVSFLTDVSSEMIFTILPLFLMNVLGVGTAIIGLIEGVGESAATLMKIVSGWLSDRLGRRKGLTTLGYTLSTIAKPFLYFAGIWGWGSVMAVKFADRVGKGIRTSPRDALVADSTTPEEMGRGFGFHRAMDTFGAVIGLIGAALIVFFLQKGAVLLSGSTFQWLVIIGVVPAVMAVLVLILFVREVGASRLRREAPTSPAPPTRGRLDSRFMLFLGIIVIFTLGNSTDAFLILRAQNIGFSVVDILMLLILFNFIYAATALPSGMLSDRLGRKVVIVAGWGVYALTYLGFALASAPRHVIVLFALYGLYYGAAEGVTRAFVADIVPEERRGTAYGLYHGAVGLSLLPASVIAGVLWQAVNPAAPFFFGAVMAGAAMLGLAILIRE